MTFEELRGKLTSRWWWPVVLAIFFSLAALPFVQETKYQSTISLNITTQNDARIVQETLYPSADEALIEIDPDAWELINPENANREYLYFRMLGTLNGYFVKRFAEVDVQARIAESIGLPPQNLSKQAPIYEISGNGLGSISFSLTHSDKAAAEQFDEAVESTFNNLVQEWNTGKDIFAVKLVDNQIESGLIEIRPHTQEYLLPPLAGLTAGICLALLVPAKPKN